MLSSPYPVPSLRLYRWAMVVGWLAAAVAGGWVLVFPPKSYDGLGLALTTAWGIMLGAGSLGAAAGHLFRTYQVEIPGVVLALGGVSIYGYLSWVQTFTDSPGSGPRACLLVLLAAILIARLRTLLYIDRQARKLADMRGDL